MSVIANTTVISNFASIGQLELLARRVIREDQRERPQDVGELAAAQPVEMGDQRVQFVEGRWVDQNQESI